MEDDEVQKTWGQVRASPSGSCLTTCNGDGEDWHQWRRDHLEPLQFPKEGFHHMYGQDVIQQVDSRPLGNNHKAKMGDALYVAEEEDDEKKVMDGRDYGSTKTTGTYEYNEIQYTREFSLLCERVFSHSYIIIVIILFDRRRPCGKCQGQVEITAVLFAASVTIKAACRFV